jgi:hypothetical protein
MSGPLKNGLLLGALLVERTSSIFTCSLFWATKAGVNLRSFHEDGIHNSDSK